MFDLKKKPAEFNSQQYISGWHIVQPKFEEFQTNLKEDFLKTQKDYITLCHELFFDLN